MKRLLLILLFPVYSSATNIYFATAGSDGGAGTKLSPYKTIGKLNSIFSSLAAGDSVLFNRGDTFYGSIIVNKSGTNGSRIVLGAYGTGAKPIISGLTYAISWTGIGTNLWETTASISTLSTCNILSQSGVNYAKGRTPNSGYYTSGYTTNNSTTITDATHLSTSTITANIGTQVVTRELMYAVNTHDITAISTNTITFGAGSIPGTPWGYFIQNGVKDCNTANEWAYNTSTKKIQIYSVASPTNISVPTIDEGINLNGKDYITFDNLSIIGYNSTGINTNSRTGITIKNCTFSFCGIYGVYSYPNSPNLVVTSNSFTDIGNNAIEGGSSSSANISGNIILRSGHFAGMGKNGDRSYTAIVSHGDNANVNYNSITYAGYCGIRFDGNASNCIGNFINNTTYIKDDGGGIYTFPDQLGNVYQTFATRTIRDNIILNSIGAAAGSPNGSQGCGLYMDGMSPNIDAIHNFIANDNAVTTGFLGIFINGGHDIFCDSNTTYNWAGGYYLTKTGGGPIDNETVTHNNLVAVTVNALCGLGQYSANYRPSASSMPSSFVASNNVYAKPLDQTHGWIFSVMPSNACSTLSQWKVTTGKDAGSTSSPKIVSDVSKILIVYNNTANTKVIGLGASYFDMKGIEHSGSISLAPYSGEVLLYNKPIVLAVYFINFVAKSDGKSTILDWTINNDGVNKSYNFKYNY